MLGSESNAVVGKIGFCTEELKLTTSDAAAEDWFGYSVAISGDVAIVGAPYDHRETGFPYAFGSAYVFVRNGEVWEEQVKLTASDIAEDEDKSFGWAVAIDGDVVTVGAIEDSGAGDDSGAAYVFVHNGDTWEEVQKLTANNAAKNDYFGWSVGISGDVAIVGTWFANSAYVFTHNGVAWEEQAKLTASDVVRGDWFGYSVGISGDVAIVGSPLDDDAGNSSGSAYVFVRNGDTWEEKKKLTANDAAAGDNFGDSVAINGDTAIVGSPSDDNAESNSGSAYIFVRNGNTWDEKKKLTSSDTASGDSFGYSVAIRGDVAIVGSPYDDDAGSNSGSAYIKYYNGCSQ